jgi:enediyne biosynthesis protein E4
MTWTRRARCFAAALAAGCAAPTSLATAQVFTNATVAAGITHNAIPTNCPSCAPTFNEEQAGGAAAGDFDGDGWTDLFITRYWDAGILYRNNQDGTFANVSATSFVPGALDHETNGVAWGDVDNDGDLDLAVSTMYESRHLLYVNNGAGSFSEAGIDRGLTITSPLPDTAGSSVSMGDYDRDGYLDMYVTEWRGFSSSSNPSQARLFRNQGAAAPGHFVDVTAAAGVAMDRVINPHANQALSFTPRFADVDRDGHTDLAVVSDGGTSRMFWNDGDGTFSNRTAAAGIATGTNDMGFTLADFNGDGLLDWFATSIAQNVDAHPAGNRLFLNDGDRTFTDVTTQTGVRMGGWGWGAEALDYDNDGDVDIVHTNGMGVADVDQTRVFKNTGTRTAPQFVDVATSVGVTDAGQGRGLLSFDYDRDGDLDVFLVNNDSAPILYRNDGGASAGDWLQIRTVGVESNRDGIGAFITVTPDLEHPEVIYVAEIDGSSTYLSQSEFVAHFGLGDVATIDQIDVEWPSGYTQRFHDVAPNQRVTITEGLLADFNGDGRVDGDDLALWRGDFGDVGSSLLCDADRDGDVDGADFLKWQRDLGRTVDSGLTVDAAVASSASVPEPAALTLLATLIVNLPWVRRAAS